MLKSLQLKKSKSNKKGFQKEKHKINNGYFIIF